MALKRAASTLRGQQSSRVEFNLEDFIDTLNKQGYDVRWSKAMFCPNRDPDQEDHHKLDCDLCDFNGFVYFDPIELKALVTSYGTKQLFMPESRYEPGTAYFTTLPEHKLSFWDRIELLTAKTRFSEVTSMASFAGATAQLKYPALSIEKIITNVGKEIPNDSAVVLKDGRIRFSERPVDDFFSISYFYHPTYIMIDLLHSVRDSRITIVGGDDKEVDFPSQAVGRLEFLVRDESAK